MFVLPLIIFEIRHPGTITHPFLQTISKLNSSQLSTKTNTAVSNLPKLVSTTFAQLFFVRPSNFAESQFCYCIDYVEPLFGTLATITIGILTLFPLFLIFKNIKKYSFKKDLLLVPYIFILTCLAGTIIFRATLKNPIHQLYFTVIFPAVFLIVAYSLTKLVKNNFVLTIILTLFLTVNLYTLFNSKFAYPLIDKEKLVQDLTSKIGTNDFSLYSAPDPWSTGGGYTGLFMLIGKSPRKSYIYPSYDWMYRAYNLYTVNPTSQDQEKIVIIGPAGKLLQTNSSIEFSETVGNIEGIILDNSTNWFTKDKLTNYFYN